MNIDKKIQSKNIELFLSLANASKLNDMSMTELTVFVMGYFDLLEAFKEKMPFLKDLSKKRQDTIVMINGTNPEDLENVRSVFSQLQTKVRGRLQVVMKAVKEDRNEQPEIVSSKVTHKVIANIQDDEFVSIFEPDKISAVLEIESELNCLAIVIDSILVGYSKKPSQLGECEKNGCSNLFFKYTLSSKYCSTRCSNAVQQTKFKKRTSKG